MFVLAIFRSQKDNNKHSYAILFVFDIFGEPNGTTKNCAVHYVCRIFWEANQTTKICLVYTWVLAFSGTKWDNKNLSHLLGFFWGVGKSTNFEA
jgi:hypothetical protein